jgi:biopolymer transport protein ExbD
MVKKFTKRRKPSEDVSLQITSMADIFVILLVFLLKSFSTGALTIHPTTGLVLPVAHASDEAVDALKLEITADAILINDSSVMALSKFEAKPDENLPDGTFQSLIKVFETLKKDDPKILVLADHRAPYGTVKRALTSAAAKGFTDFKLVVVEDR